MEPGIKSWGGTSWTNMHWMSNFIFKMSSQLRNMTNFKIRKADCPSTACFSYWIKRHTITLLHSPNTNMQARNPPCFLFNELIEDWISFPSCTEETYNAFRSMNDSIFLNTRENYISILVIRKPYHVSRVQCNST